MSVKFIRDAVQRSQLTGGESLKLDTGQRIGDAHPVSVTWSTELGFFIAGKEICPLGS